MCLSRDCGLVSLGHPLGTGVVRKAPARDVLMVLGVAVAWTILVSSTIFINIKRPRLRAEDSSVPKTRGCAATGSVLVEPPTAATRRS